MHTHGRGGTLALIYEDHRRARSRFGLVLRVENTYFIQRPAQRAMGLRPAGSLPSNKVHVTKGSEEPRSLGTF